MRWRNRTNVIAPTFFMALGQGPEVKLGTGNECYHIKYEKI